MTEIDKGEEFLKHGQITLDLSDLTDAQRAECSFFLGGAEAKFVKPGDSFSFDEVSNIAFNWGDENAEGYFAQLIEHIEPPTSEYMPYAASTLIDGRLWELHVQDAGFDPEEVYDSPDDYILIPYDSQVAVSILASLELPVYPKQIVGKVDSRYFIFSGSISIEPDDISARKAASSNELQMNEEQLTYESVLDFAERLVTHWEYDDMEDGENYMFALNISHWVMETFGIQGDTSGELSIFSEQEIKGTDLPPSVQPVALKVWQDEIFYTDHNSLFIVSQHDYVENDPVIPRWEEFEHLPTFEEQLAFMRANPDIIEGLVPTTREVMPQTKIRFEPDSYFGSRGFELITSDFGIEIVPFGKAGQTGDVVNFAFDKRSRPVELTKMVCQLSILAAKTCRRPYNREFSEETIELLLRRLDGSSDITPILSSVEDKAKNSIKNLLVDTILKEQPET